MGLLSGVWFLGRVCMYLLSSSLLYGSGEGDFGLLVCIGVSSGLFRRLGTGLGGRDLTEESS